MQSLLTDVNKATAVANAAVKKLIYETSPVGLK
jgi:vesicle coat complex subunit